jgi:hypothetical protein
MTVYHTTRKAEDVAGGKPINILHDFCIMISFLTISKNLKNTFVEWSTAHHAMYLQFNVSGNAFKIKAVQNPKCIVWCAVNCTIVRKRWRVPYVGVDVRSIVLHEHPQTNRIEIYWELLRSKHSYIGTDSGKWLCVVLCSLKRSKIQIEKCDSCVEADVLSTVLVPGRRLSTGAR